MQKQKKVSSVHFDFENLSDFPVDSGTVSSMFETILNEQLPDLNMQNTKVKREVQIVDGGGSGAEGNLIRVAPDTGSGESCFLENLDLLFRHELTHLLLAEACGTGNIQIIFWEGIPNWFAENKVRTIKFGFSYHEYCRAFLVSDKLLPLNLFVIAHDYYSMRRDFRYDLQAASFCGYLAGKYGIDSIIGALKEFQPPTPDHPVIEISKLLMGFSGKKLSALEKDWQKFLLNKVTARPDREERAASYTLPSFEEPPYTHCGFCNDRYDRSHTHCPYCGVDTGIVLSVR
ncbi:MAG: hypothetical protein PHQ23_03820, partial [Candidatus Wallbacteria bacterium]|nr:hypothetical protein [Candidatus Wallbacteria bacterium]